MANIAWSDSLSLGIEEVDVQHKKLISLVNRLLVALREKRASEDLKDIFHELSEYTVYHFNAEENYMLQLEYPKLEKHREQHSLLKKEVRDFQSRIFHQEQIDIEEVKGFIRSWLIEHILQHDLEIAKHKARVEHDSRVEAEEHIDK